ncbi:MAG: periplasmic Cu(I)/Cu(II)-binding protein CopK [Sterolibacterium sp.]|jgi:hypothetical protein
MLNKILLVTAIGAIATSAFAIDNLDVQKTVELKDGVTVVVFNDGKMAMENKYGRIVRMAPGHVMETKDGQKITMQGDEVARLANIRALDRGG